MTTVGTLILRGQSVLHHPHEKPQNSGEATDNNFPNDKFLNTWLQYLTGAVDDRQNNVELMNQQESPSANICMDDSYDTHMLNYTSTRQPDLPLLHKFFKKLRSNFNFIGADVKSKWIKMYADFRGKMPIYRWILHIEDMLMCITGCGSIRLCIQWEKSTKLWKK
ncbi:unnamed protein product [Mytilus coruscus]|uniref:Uncharacterized protein n=1 Tax=Mytilus coruscus TaxID=42192 RepID=A0A6J8EJS4_MYTCO|nr:unnamed protein product [Mytilus coruscus]